MKVDGVGNAVARVGPLRPRLPDLDLDLDPEVLFVDLEGKSARECD